jgi:hypothetical protein
MKKLRMVFTITLLVISSQLFTNCEEKKETAITSKSVLKPLTEAQKKPIGKLEQNGKPHPMVFNTKNGKILQKEKKYEPVMTK